MSYNIGRIDSIKKQGLLGWVGILTKEGRGGMRFSFVLANCVGGYQNQTPRELTQFSKKGLVAGTIVKFEFVNNTRLKAIKIIYPLLFE
jgi:hypothetical protein